MAICDWEYAYTTDELTKEIRTTLIVLADRINDLTERTGRLPLFSDYRDSLFRQQKALKDKHNDLEVLLALIAQGRLSSIVHLNMNDIIYLGITPGLERSTDESKD